MELKHLLRSQRQLNIELKKAKSEIIGYMLEKGLNTLTLECGTVVTLTPLKRKTVQTSSSVMAINDAIEREQAKICEASCQEIRDRQTAILKLQAEIQEMQDPRLTDLNMKLAREISKCKAEEFSLTIN